MKLTVLDVARMFDTTERGVERWIRDDGLPHERVYGQYRFNRADLIEWATRRNVPISGEEPLSLHPGRMPPTFAQALAVGGVHHHVKALDRDSLLRAIVDLLPIEDESERDLLFEVLRVRETAGTTGIGEGIAIPHVRTPVILNVAKAAVSLCFLEKPIDFKSIDGKPVDSVFLFVTPNIHSHLFLLTRLSVVLHDQEFRTALRDKASADVILAQAKRAEEALAETADEESAEATP